MIALAPSERHRVVAGTFAAVVAGVADWDAPTPVPEWRAADVLDHLVEWPVGLLAAGGVDISPAAIARRSAIGSRTFPSSDTCPVRLAIVPSTQSVATTTTKSTRPHAEVSSSTISAQKTGIAAIRSAEIRFGTVSTREDGERSPDVCIGRDGGT